MDQEKRQAVRQRIGRLLYAELGSDNASILLDLSEQGCSFQAIAPVRDDQLPFTVSVGDGRKIAGNAQVTWRDPTRKIGGLHFVAPSHELRDQIRSWMASNNAPDRCLLAGERIDSEAKRRRKQLRDEARIQADAGHASQSTKLPARPDRAATTASVGMGTREVSLGQVQSVQSAGVGLPTGTRAGAWWGALAIGATALLVITMIAYRQEVGRRMMRFGATIAGEPQRAPALPPGRGPVPNVSVQDSPSPQTVSVGAPDENQIQTANQQITSESADLGPSRKPSLAQSADLTQDIPSLWARVESGDTSAELVLADRYLRGDGVLKSCAQARVLLEAAVKRGNDEARRKLSELSQSGCP